MAAINFPAGGIVLTSEYDENPTAVVRRTEMEAGPAKQAPSQSQVFNNFTLSMLYTAAEYAAFITWYKATAKNGSLFFNITHPRTDATVEGRIVGGAYSAVPINAKLGHFRVKMVVETLL